MLPKIKENYGSAPWVDALAVANPQTQQAANQANRQAEDTAQLTRTCWKALLRFTTTNAVPPVFVSPLVGTTTIWGSQSALYPTVQKTATGLYVITYAATFVDSLVGTTADSVSETETTDFRFIDVSIVGLSNALNVLKDVVVNVATVQVYDTLWAPTDTACELQVYLR